MKERKAKHNTEKRVSGNCNRNSNKVVVTSNPLFLYFCYVVLIWFIEAVDLICYVSNVPNATILSRLVVLALFLLLLYKARKYVCIEKHEITKFELCGIVILMLFGIMKGIYPDGATDTFNYHLIAQRPGFINYFSQSFAKGNFQVWGFRLGDRLFYPFRMLLGYRMGTVLNTAVLVLLYSQTIVFLKSYIIKDKEIEALHIKSFRILLCPEAWALAIVMAQQILFMMGIYYVDILALPIAIECLRLLMDTCERKPTNAEMYYFAGLAGIWFAFKMTNIVFIAPIVLIYIISVHKRLSVKNTLVCASLCAAPCSVYLIHAYLDTENPVFPYYNTIFQSPYFKNIDFKDARWGPVSFWETVLWPFYRVVRPDYRQAELSNGNTFLSLLGIICVLWTVLSIFLYVRAKKEVNVKRAVLCILFLVSGFLWSISAGYLRYFIMGDWFLGIHAYGLIYDFAIKKHVKHFSDLIVFGVITLSLCISLLQSMINAMAILEGQEWSWRVFSVESAKSQLASVFRDRDFFENSIKSDFFLITKPIYTGIADIAEKDVYVFNLDYLNQMPDNNELQYAKEKLATMNGIIRDIKDTNWSNAEDYVERMNQIGIYIESIECMKGQTGIFCIPALANNGETNRLYPMTDGIALRAEEGANELCFMLLSKSITYDQCYTIKVLDEQDTPIFEEVLHADNQQIDYCVDIIGGESYRITVQGENLDDVGERFFVLNPRTQAKIDNVS